MVLKNSDLNRDSNLQTIPGYQVGQSHQRDDRHGTLWAKETLKVMKFAILSHSIELITLVFFANSNCILVGIFQRICLDSLNPTNEHKNSLFPLTKSNCVLNNFTIFSRFVN